MARGNTRMAPSKVLNVVLASLAAATLSFFPSDALAQARASKKSVDSLGSVIKEVTRIRDEVRGATGSLSELTAGDQAKLAKHFKAYSKHVKKMAKAQTTTRRRVEDMQARRDAYRQEWEEEMDAVTSPEIKAHMQERKQEVGRTFDRAQPPLQTAREAFTPFLAHLQDIERMLSVDLSRSGVSAATPIAQKAMGEGSTIISALDTLISVLSEVKAQVSASGK